MKESKATITIPAPPHEVWKVLVDLESYKEWNPMFVQASGAIAASSQDGTATELTQGERYVGWGKGFYSSFGDTHRGFIAMNNALNQETLRRRAAGTTTGDSEDIKRKEKCDSNQDKDTQQDITDLGAVVPVASGAGTVPEKEVAPETEHCQSSEDKARVDGSSPALPTSSTISEEEPAEGGSPTTIGTARKSSEKPREKTEKRSSIIGAVSSLFCSSRQSLSERVPTSTSKVELISKAVLEEQEGDNKQEDCKALDSDGMAEVEDKGDGTAMEPDELEGVDNVAKKAREAKNAERIELDFGSGSMDLGDFGF
ncbi:hypothetical protein BGX31_006435 [Mortierella sp. GBA43]|nr:hypothetical protein BGX31_006435 [Mortierella sp. GBA43]